MTINFKVPEIKELQPRLLVMGIGGAGGNAINEICLLYTSPSPRD